VLRMSVNIGSVAKCETMGLRINGREGVANHRHRLFDNFVAQVETT
jgi:hypothetical protein